VKLATPIIWELVGARKAKEFPIGSVEAVVSVCVFTAPPFAVQLIAVTDPASCPPWKVAMTAVAFGLVRVADTTFVFWIFPAMPNTNAAMTAARITVIATIRITPMTGDTASSFFLVNTIVSNTLKNARTPGTTLYDCFISHLGI